MQHHVTINLRKNWCVKVAEEIELTVASRNSQRLLRSVEISVSII